MKRILYLSTCDTCKRIMKETGIEGFELQDIKSTPIDSATLTFLRSFVDGYEDLFNKRSRKFKSEVPNPEQLKDEDWKELILSEYTFLKRPVYIIDKRVFVGNSKKTVDAIKAVIGE